MKYILATIIMANLFFSSCGQDSSLEVRQKKTMQKIIDAILTKDTVIIYQIINAKGNKEQLDYDILFLNKELSKINYSAKGTDFKIVSGLLKDGTYYRLRIYINNIRFDYVDLDFAFYRDDSDHVFSFGKEIHLINADTIRIPKRHL